RRRRALEVLRSAFIPWLATVNPDNDQPMRRGARGTHLPPPRRPLIDALVDRRPVVRAEGRGPTGARGAVGSMLRPRGRVAGWGGEGAANPTSPPMTSSATPPPGPATVGIRPGC